MVVEQLTGQSVQDALTKLVIQPLGIEAYLGAEPPRVPAIITDPPDQHVGTSLELWNTPFWRSLGEPDSGMVTTPTGTVGLLRAYLGVPRDFLRLETRVAATHDQTGGLGGGFPWQEWAHCPMGLGPFIIAEQMNHFLLPTAAAGTLCLGGYSGCGVFADPAANVIWSIHGTRTGSDGWTSQAFPLISAAVLASGG
jgi:CubicO group peptidase (beta-lactamase class C family)